MRNIDGGPGCPRQIPQTEGVVSIRIFGDTDRAYVSKTWLMAMSPKREDQDSASRARFFGSQSLAISYRLNHSRCLVACLSDSPEVICGFVCFDPEQEHVYCLNVRSDWRGQGIGGALLDAAWETVTVKDLP